MHDRQDELREYREFIENDAEEFRAYMAGINVGIELMESGMNEELTEDEFGDWVRKQYQRRVREDE